MKPADAYLKAAKALEKRAASPWQRRAKCEYACEALDAVMGGKDKGDALADAMKKAFDGKSMAWLADTGDRELDRPIRVLALCFMAAMVEAGDVALASAERKS